MTDETNDFALEVDARIGANLRTSREAQGISQSELARRLDALGIPGFHQTTIARLEKGQRSLRASEAFALCRILDISMDRLVESQENTKVRSHMAYLREKTAAFDAASRELVHTIRLVATYLDSLFPYGEEDISSDEVIERSGVEKSLYEHIEDNLARASPHERLAEIYGETIHSMAHAYLRRPNNEHKSRLEFILEGMRDWAGGDEASDPSGLRVNDRSAEPDDVFEREVLALFAEAGG